jgi:hypothetical protein
LPSLAGQPRLDLRHHDAVEQFLRLPAHLVVAGDEDRGHTVVRRDTGIDAYLAGRAAVHVEVLPVPGAHRVFEDGLGRSRHGVVAQQDESGAIGDTGQTFSVGAAANVFGAWVEVLPDEVVAAAMDVADHNLLGATRQAPLDACIHVLGQEPAPLLV